MNDDFVFLTGSLPVMEKLKRIQYAIQNSSVNCINIVGQDFGSTDEDPLVVPLLMSLFHTSSVHSHFPSTRASSSSQEQRSDDDDDDDEVEEEGEAMECQRQWKKVQLLHCVDSGDGRTLESFIQLLLTHCNICKLTISCPEVPLNVREHNYHTDNYDVQQMYVFRAIRRGLQLQRIEQQKIQQHYQTCHQHSKKNPVLVSSPSPSSSSSSLDNNLASPMLPSVSALCLTNMTNLNACQMAHLAIGLSNNGSIANREELSSSSSSLLLRSKQKSRLPPPLVELSFQDSTFRQDGVDTLASHIGEWAFLQHLNLQGCKLNDQQCESIIDALSGYRNDDTGPNQKRCLHCRRPVGIMELCLDGNYCHKRGMDALARYVSTKHNNLMVVDVASQIYDMPRQQHVARRNGTAADTTVAAIDEDPNETTSETSVTSLPSMDLHQFSKALSSPNCRLCGLQLSDNRIPTDSMIAVWNALKTCSGIKIVHMAWCTMTDEGAKAIGEALRQNTSITKLVLYECKLTDTLLSNIVCGFHENDTLKKLDISGKQRFTMDGLKLLETSIKENERIEYVSVHEPHQRDVSTALTVEQAKQSYEQMLGIEFQCDMNRASRGLNLLRRISSISSPSSLSSDSSSAIAITDTNSTAHKMTQETTTNTKFSNALIPLLLERPSKMDLPIIRDQFGGSTPQDTLLSAYRRRMSCAKNRITDDDRRRASVLFHLIRNANTLHESLGR